MSRRASGPPLGGTMVSEIFDASRWRPVEGFNFTDLTYRAIDQGTVRIA